MITYHVDVDVRTATPVDPDACVALEAQFPPGAGAAVGQSHHDACAVSVSLAVDAANADEAERNAGALIVSALSGAGLVSVETLDRRVVRWDLFESELDVPNFPDIVSATEAAAILGVSRQRVHQLMREHPGFPEPLYHLRGTGPLWVRAGIEAFARRWDRRPGRPPKTVPAAS